ncbi:MAG: sugar phosphate nucleotidyltransferase [Candidatus Nanoarchaeia archaeon]|nr:sugar phosphate nucleotidyltransferase [Candidatus Nanoarchaeia archaeon]
MKAVIMAAGRGERCYPLTLTRPKPMLKIINKTVLEHNLEQINGLVDEAIIVVGYKKEMIKEKFKKKYKKIKITFVEQEKQLGTGHALMQAEKFINGKFILMNGDDLFSRTDIEKCLLHDYCVLGQEVANPENFGIIYSNKGILKEIIEKSENPKSNIANIGLYILDDSIFGILKTIKKTKRQEYELPTAINKLAKNKKVCCEKVDDYWLPITYPWNYLEANVFMLNRIKKTQINGKIEQDVTIKGKVFVGDGTIIKSGSYIEGPVYIGDDCEIGPNAFIRKDTIIMDMVRTRAEIVDSVLMEGVTAKHVCYLGHSVIGENSNIGASTISADYRHDTKENMTVVNGKKVNTHRRKLGSFIGDNVNTGIGTLIYPGRKIWPNLGTLPGEIVAKDKTE